ncbi:MAG: hypothetical protein VKI81_09545, partial [Synechococcaceae cyanobacterium]|nr:hypothetical protein [Synechococcaceae cyanobacterium]
MSLSWSFPVIGAWFHYGPCGGITASGGVCLELGASNRAIEHAAYLYETPGHARKSWQSPRAVADAMGVYSRRGAPMKERLARLYETAFGHRPDVILDLAADGSTRQYFRLRAGDHESAIGAIGPDHDENRAFLEFARAFRGIGLPVPEI